mmetsp:Transcript_79873/g.158237  ORF Transcript_79873/g.158237 Transcript_79873/m.158237 type:complete len:246 (-) Transcript_79873:35-772(-)
MGNTVRRERVMPSQSPAWTCLHASKGVSVRMGATFFPFSGTISVAGFRVVGQSISRREELEAQQAQSSVHWFPATAPNCPTPASQVKRPRKAAWPSLRIMFQRCLNAGQGTAQMASMTLVVSQLFWRTLPTDGLAVAQKRLQCQRARPANRFAGRTCCALLTKWPTSTASHAATSGHQALWRTAAKKVARLSSKAGKPNRSCMVTCEFLWTSMALRSSACGVPSTGRAVSRPRRMRFLHVSITVT